MLKLKYNWVAILIGVFLSTIMSIVIYNTIISSGIDLIKQNGNGVGDTIAIERIESGISERAVDFYWRPYFYMFLAVSIFIVLAYLINHLFLRKNSKFIWRLLTMVGFSALCSGIILGSIEPYIARDAVEYGVRQELNQIFEIIGYLKINFIIYLIPLVGAISLAIFTKSYSIKDEKLI